MTGPIVAQAGIVRVELGPARHGDHEVWSAGELVGYLTRLSACSYTAVAGDVRVYGISPERAAVALAVALDQDYVAWRGTLPVRCTDAGSPSGEAA